MIYNSFRGITDHKYSLNFFMCVHMYVCVGVCVYSDAGLLHVQLFSLILKCCRYNPC